MSILQPVLRPVLQPLSLSLTRAGVAIWTPRRLFAAGEQGAWYDPSDLSTLYQDAAGTTPVTAVGQPVGLVLDKRLTAGPELADPTAVYVKNTDNPLVIATGMPLVAGARYLVSFRKTNHTVGAPGVDLGGSNYSGLLSDIGTDKTITLAITTTNAGDAFATAGQLAISGTAARLTISNVSVRLLDGNHASQSTTTARPTLQQDSGGRYYLSFDGVDDALSLGNVLPFATNSFSVMLALQSLLSSSGQGGIFSRRGTGSPGTNPGWGLRSINNTINLELDDGTANSKATASIGSNLISGKCVSSAMINRASTASSYFNGALDTPSADISLVGNVSGTRSLILGGEPTNVYYFKGRIYGLVCLGRLPSANERQSAERYLAARAGVTL